MGWQSKKTGQGVLAVQARKKKGKERYIKVEKCVVLRVCREAPIEPILTNVVNVDFGLG